MFLSLALTTLRIFWLFCCPLPSFELRVAWFLAESFIFALSRSAIDFLRWITSEILFDFMHCLLLLSIAFYRNFSAFLSLFTIEGGMCILKYLQFKCHTFHCIFLVPKRKYHFLKGWFGYKFSVYWPFASLL
jgi:hypothetical protein